MSDLGPSDYATGASHGMASPFRLDHSSVLGFLMLVALALLGVIHFAFGVNIGVGVGR